MDMRTANTSGQEASWGKRPETRVVGPRELLTLLRRRFFVIAGIVAVCTSGAVAYSMLATKQYSATSMVLLDRTDTKPWEADADLKKMERDKTALDTEMDRLKSRVFIGKVVDELKLMEDDEFNPYLSEAPDQTEAAEKAPAAASALALSESDPETYAIQRDRTISSFLPQVATSRTGDSLAISIQVTAGEPDKAALLANGVADVYVAELLAQKRADADQAAVDANAAPEAAQAALNSALPSSAAALAQPLIVTLRGEEATLQRQRAELAAIYGKNHPKIQSLDAQIKTIEDLMRAEGDRVTKTIAQEAARPGARVVSYAEVPQEPSFPKPKLIVAGGLLGSTLLAFLVAFMLESMDTRIRTGDRVQEILQLPNLAYVPRIPRTWLGGRQSPLAYLRSRPRSPFAEAVKSLYLACRVWGTDRSHQLIMLTSCLADEERTTIALGLGAISAADEKRTVLVDFDNSVVEARPHAEDWSGSVDALIRRECVLQDLVETRPDAPGLDIITVDDHAHAVGGVVGSDRLRKFFQILRSEYDVILVNTPAVLVVDDAAWLCPLVDVVLLMVQYERTTEDELFDAATRLHMNHAPLLGTVIDGVNPKNFGRSSFLGMRKLLRLRRKPAVR
jgi:uncharacterized protein involved in exopolysaccharide biosynthesis/Mrp family chromosome partitioning ATPase